MKKLVIASLPLYLVFLLACHKDHNNPPTSPTDSTTNLKIDLSVGANYELIISEPAGTVLLDTIVAPFTHISTILKTSASLFDVSTIDTASGKFYITTYKAVNPSSWTNVGIFYHLAPYPTLASKNPSESIDTTLYLNAPNDPYYRQYYVSGATYVSFYSTYNQIQSTYWDLPGRYSYLCFVDKGLYNLHMSKTSNDTVDCTHMDTAVYGNYTTSSYFTYSESFIFGYPDSTDLGTGLELYINFYNTPQYLYPPKGIQKYMAQAIFSGPKHDTARSYTFGNTISPDVTYPDENAGPVNTSNNNLSLDFDNTKPSYYFTTWIAPTISWTLYASPDSTSLNPLNLLTKQKSKLLRGQDLSSLSLTQFYYETVQGYNYQNFLSMACDSLQAPKAGITNAVFYERSY